MTGLIRPTDVIMEADGSLLVADYNYGLVWRVSYGSSPTTQTTPSVLETLGIQPMAATAAPTLNPNAAAATSAPSGFATNTPSAP
jgi:hypothetical protein